MSRWILLCTFLSASLLSHGAAAEEKPEGGVRLELGVFAGGALPMQEPKFSAGPSYGATVLLRPIWWTSIGLTIQKASYGYHAVGFKFDEPNGSYESTAKGLAWRLYLTDEEWVEPYFQAFLASASVEVSGAGLVTISIT